MMQTMEQIKDIFKDMYINNIRSEDGNIEILNCAFVVTADSFFGKPNQEYITAEQHWYSTESDNVNDLGKLYGFVPEMWKNIASPTGQVNSNYGKLAHSNTNGSQFEHCYSTLVKDKNSRRAQIIFTRPSMHTDAFKDGMNDFLCINTAHFMIRDNTIHIIVNMRASDAVYGFNADMPYMQLLLNGMFLRLSHVYRGLNLGRVMWHADTLHIYPRHFKLIHKECFPI